jgi:hypothetical protein
MSPLPKGTRYRFKKGTKVRLAFSKGSNKVIETKNMETGDTHTVNPTDMSKTMKKMRGRRK